MARLDWVRQRLENWARWCAMRDAGGPGYPRQSAFLREAAQSQSTDDGIRVDSLDASITDQAVTSLRFTQPHLYIVLTLTYARGLPRHLVAKRMARAESTIKANLETADHAVARWFHEREAEHARRRDQIDAARLYGRVQAVSK